MGGTVSRTTTVFSRAFTVPGFDEVVPAGEYVLESELAAPSDHLTPETWKASVLVHLHPRMSHPGLRRTLSVSLADLEAAIDRDTLPTKELERLFLEEMLVDPMIRLVMQADGVSDAELRSFYDGFQRPAPAAADPAPRHPLVDAAGVQIVEKEGMPPRSDQPAIGPSPQRRRRRIRAAEQGDGT